MRQKYYQLAKELKGHIESDAHISILDFRIFGSCAREEEEEDSDVDVFIKVDTLTRQAKQAIKDVSWNIGFKHLMVISPLIYDKEEFEQSVKQDSPIIENILNEGISI